MKKYTYYVQLYIDVNASNEYEAVELARDELPVEPTMLTLYEVEEEEQDWDAIVDERRLGL